MLRKFINKYLFALFFSFSLLLTFDAQAQEVDGRQVFKSNCATCHMMERSLTGPALDGSFQRVQDYHGFSEEETHEWMKSWIRNSQAMIAEGDEYANKIYDEWDQTQMNSFVSLPEQEIEAVIHYIRYWDDPEKYPPEGPTTAQTAGGQQDQQADAEGGISTNLLLLILVIALLAIALILGRITNVLGKVASEKQGEAVKSETPFYLNKKFLTILVLAAVVFVGFRVVRGAIDLGRQQDYAPEQPIQYSHKLHAGVLEIDCKYCHYNSFRGKTAAIPSTNVCMNCHKYVNKGPTAEFKAQHDLAGPAEDTTEIAKIYDAVGWDPQKQEYDKSEAEPVEWVRIHNLPDHVYFNHAQHVDVGNLECQTCHGQVQEFEVMKQESPLSMGWCINCHRETEVDFANNGYYDHYYEDYHQAIEDGEIDGVTVEMIGGTECQKCHY